MLVLRHRKQQKPLTFINKTVIYIAKFLFKVKSTLIDLKLAIDGTIVMSLILRQSLDSMYDARIPERWLKVCTITQYDICFIECCFQKLF